MKRFFLIAVCFMVVVSVVYAGDFTYIGAKKCKMCHKGAKKGEVWEKWEQSPHAKALETLKAKGEDKNAKCLGCHVTDVKAAADEGVGCEACHGPGSAYKKMSVMKDRQKSIENGMVVPNEETCKRCHNKNSPTFKGFDFNEFFKKIDHRYTKK
jgi:hypothetical protein